MEVEVFQGVFVLFFNFVGKFIEVILIYKVYNRLIFQSWWISVGDIEIVFLDFFYDIFG